MSKISKKIKNINKMNNQEMQKELSRAHMIIALLCLSIIVLLSIGVSEPVTFEPTLSAICVVLLSIVAFISLSMTYALSKKKK